MAISINDVRIHLNPGIKLVNNKHKHKLQLIWILPLLGKCNLTKITVPSEWMNKQANLCAMYVHTHVNNNFWGL